MVFGSNLIVLVQKNKEAMDLDLAEKYTQVFTAYFSEQRLVEQLSKSNKCELTWDELCTISLSLMKFFTDKYNHDIFTSAFDKWFDAYFDPNVFRYEVGVKPFNVTIFFK